MKVTRVIILYNYCIVIHINNKTMTVDGEWSCNNDLSCRPDIVRQALQ